MDQYSFHRWSTSTIKSATDFQSVEVHTFSNRLAWVVGCIPFQIFYSSWAIIKGIVPAVYLATMGIIYLNGNNKFFPDPVMFKTECSGSIGRYRVGIINYIVQIQNRPIRYPELNRPTRGVVVRIPNGQLPYVIAGLQILDGINNGSPGVIIQVWGIKIIEYYGFFIIDPTRSPFLKVGSFR